ncbi:MAG: sodium ion-translocating decarboxylase subunit beta [Sphaerochaeta sp.]|uniref:sodium ion-translocating decarboxylase subunit beta n=1 Tax=Sphaerochaeta sp. TaxID=1972642 RepID=UPI001DC96709|nr:sodium ion-translocating decarboxylase subunit beta [uncultured Sphaerochaeta sp.]MDD3058706.1 sodium ion-translocating decarboxylase subunit beta [Sphaerochaeta sp.]MDD3929371.1 sodium ion-translocating decarboxylase subunit beta [Sphaerochaeta sp.]NCC13108.1 sodium ion-translocating decarboxylase subunit beta [Spirochaetia bacterium]NCC91080.1 sodium ion-translocating decarboxylase subunit beta [Spirochaetia bacterium]
MIGSAFNQLWQSTGLFGFMGMVEGFGIGNLVMILVGFVLLYLAIKKGFEPLLLVPIGFGCILSNIPMGYIASIDPSTGAAGFIKLLFDTGIDTGLFPILIFMGVGAMTDFGPLIANPKTLLLGAAAQAGIFVALLGALALSFIPGISFDLYAAASIGIIGGADGPTAIYVTSRLAPNLLGPIAVAAYSYMALVPIIQPPIMRALTTKEERMIKMQQLRPVSKLEKILFPITVLTTCAILLPSATPLIGSLMFGNLAKECGVVNRLSDTMQNALMNIVTIFLGLSVGSKMEASHFLNLNTLGILLLGMIAFSIGTGSGVLIAKLMNKLDPKHPVNPLIGSAGVSAVPMAARVSSKVGQESDPQNFLLMHAMGPNVAGVIGSAVAAGVLLAVVPFMMA